MRVNHSGNNTPQGSDATEVKHPRRHAASASGEVSQPETRSSQSVKHAHHHPVQHPDAKTEISNKSREFGHAKQVASAAPDIREDRVHDLKRRIADRSYKVDHDAIADRMVDEHLKMSGIG